MMIIDTFYQICKSVVKKTVFASAYWRLADLKRTLGRFHKSIYGFRFKGPVDMLNGKFEPYLSSYVSMNTAGFAKLVNIGANVGIYPCIALQHNYKQVVAVEPDRVNFRILEQNIARNGWSSRTTLMNVACSQFSGFSQIFGRGTGASLIPMWEGNANSDGVPIRTVTLDSILVNVEPGEKTLVLIDVEGYEFDAIKGASQALKQPDTFVWLIEVSLYRSIGGSLKLSPELGEFFSSFLKLGYQAFVWDSDWRHLSESAIQKYCRGEVVWPALPFLFQKN
jgi:FkbM family methyltransferase